MSVLAYLITRPVFPLGVAVWLARRVEQRDAAAVTQALLGTPAGPLANEPASLTTTSTTSR